VVTRHNLEQIAKKGNSEAALCIPIDIRLHGFDRKPQYG
jgi:hypothetical protein